MLSLLQFIIWDVSPEIFSTPWVTPRWYGLLFALGFLIGQQIMFHMFKKEGKSEKDVEALTIYMVLSTVIGARLGHCLFYEPKYYLSNPIEILKVWEGGLASHGATIGILFALWLYARGRKDQSYLWIVDRIVVTVALAGCFIRLGNLMNSEIIGKPTDVPWAFVFAHPAEEALQSEFEEYVAEADVRKAGADTVIDNKPYAKLAYDVAFTPKVPNEGAASTITNVNFPDIIEHSQRQDDDEKHILIVPEALNAQVARKNNVLTSSFNVYGIPRHPSQLYESLSCLVLFLFLLGYWNRYKAATPEGSLLGIFLVYIFGLRFFYEFLKENQVEFEDNLALNMGQWLSIPAVLGGIVVLIIANRNAKKKAAQIKA